MFQTIYQHLNATPQQTALSSPAPMTPRQQQVEPSVLSQPASHHQAPSIHSIRSMSTTTLNARVSPELVIAIMDAKRQLAADELKLAEAEDNVEDPDTMKTLQKAVRRAKWKLDDLRTQWETEKFRASLKQEEEELKLEREKTDMTSAQQAQRTMDLFRPSQVQPLVSFRITTTPNGPVTPIMLPSLAEKGMAQCLHLEDIRSSQRETIPDQGVTLTYLADGSLYAKDPQLPFGDGTLIYDYPHHSYERIWTMFSGQKVVKQDSPIGNSSLFSTSRNHDTKVTAPATEPSLQNQQGGGEGPPKGGGGGGGSNGGGDGDPNRRWGPLIGGGGGPPRGSAPPNNGRGGGGPGGPPGGSGGPLGGDGDGVGGHDPVRRP
ncbi:hypothetical protein V5O48_015417 [Marasmius crinis-equi]|uniref:Uncharacterized protein n=1 Tax=Marasmius crinis-equi TaxID=585013 RepID=A0ABR3EUY0_9AGAR